jgi:hypothetical protein
MTRRSSPDPAGLGAVDLSIPQSWNRYAYVSNTPLFMVDPLGLTPQTPSLQCGPTNVGSSARCSTSTGGGDCQLDGVDTDCGIVQTLVNGGVTNIDPSTLFSSGNGTYQAYLSGGCVISIAIGGGTDTTCTAGQTINLYLGNSGNSNSPNNSGSTVRATPQLRFEPPSWHGFIHKFLPCYGAQLIDNFVGDDGKATVTAATVAALKLKNPWAAGAALVVWTGTNAFQAGSACAVSSRAVYQ